MNHLRIFQRGALFSLFLLTAVAPLVLASSGADTLKAMPIQHNGRVKSFDAFCRQTLESIAGKENWEHRSSIDAILEALTDRNAIPQIPWVRMPSKILSTKLGLPENRLYFSYDEILVGAEIIESLARSAQAKHDREEKPLREEQEAQVLFGRMITVKELMSGDPIKVIPVPSENDAWLSPYYADDLRSRDFKKMISLYGEKKEAAFKSQAKQWIDQTHQSTARKFLNRMNLEIIYFAAQPFQWAWIFYLLAFVALTAFRRQKMGLVIGISLLGSAFFFHSLGLILRILILERPPVSNMYESMIYMNWALMVFASGFSILKKNLTFVSVGSAISALIMIYGSLLPLDANLEVLVPVLRSNYWLTVHVLTIVSSYGALGLAMGLGHRHLIFYLRRKFSKASEEASAKLIHQVIQLGVLLLGIGTVLGGVWANESWGRFWGWDPKETWALITFLGYLIIVHLRYSKLINSFWLAVSSIVGFFLVLMTWYGVNFVLGKGLHSYGFGSGGIAWVIFYLIFEMVFLMLAIYKRYTPSR